jgi:hypothetical protein
VAALEAELATLRAPRPSAWDFGPTPSEPRTALRINTLVGSNGLPHDPRELRRLVEAVALCKGVSSPRLEIAKSWESVIRVLYGNLTVKRLPWREALQEAGLTPPDDLTAHTLELRRELHGLWDRLPPLVAWAKKHCASSHVYKNLIDLYRRLLE